MLDQTPPPRDSLAWRFRFADDGEYTLRFDGRRWTVGDEVGADVPDVIVHTTTDAWARFLVTPPEERRAVEQGVDIQGSPAAVDGFVQLLGRFPKDAD